MNTTATLPTLVEARRADQGDLIVGLVVPFNEVTALTQHAEGERFTYGAFTAAVLQVRAGARLPLVLDHDETRRIGSVVHLEQVPRGLLAGLRFDAGPEGQAAAQIAVRGALPLSVGFIARETAHGWDGTRVVTKADLQHVAVVPISAYGSARSYPQEVPALATRSAEAGAVGHIRSHVPAPYADLWR